MSADRKIEGKGPSLNEIGLMIEKGSAKVVPVVPRLVWNIEKEKETLATMVFDTPTGNLIVTSSGGESDELTDR